ncbi:KptA family-domain-containing protein [Morchella snyderi]|nr:KptA family-domain-containing protein [Morchella snyderi]
MRAAYTLSIRAAVPRTTFHNLVRTIANRTAKFATTPIQPMSETQPAHAPTRGRGGRGGGGRGGGGGNNNDDRTISKALSLTLRHAAEKEGLKLRSDGYANAAELLVMPKFKKLGLTFTRLQQIVRDNDKQRYTLVLASTVQPADATPAEGGVAAPAISSLTVTEAPSSAAATEAAAADPSQYLIRANQGHSITLSSESLQLTPLDPATLPVAVHGTFYGAYEAIVASGHLSRMGRNHIHLASAETGVISGMRMDAEVLVYVDVVRAVKEGGLAFWMSANGVVLTEGDEGGFLSLRFVERIVDRRGELGVLWEGGKVVRELPEGLRGRPAPRGKGRGGRGRGGRGRGRGVGAVKAEVVGDRVDAGDP